MRALLNTAIALLLLAFVLIGASYGMLRAQATGGAGTAGGHLLASETRPLARAVAAIDLNGPFNLVLRQGATPALEVRGEERVLANVDTVLDGATLRIAPRGILLRHRQPIELRVTLPALNSLHVDGSGDTSVGGFTGERLDVTMDGSGSMRFNGRYRSIRAGVHGSSELELTGGNSDAVVAELVGSGTLTLVGASASLHAELHGAGDLDARHLRADVVTLVQEGSGDSSVYARRKAVVTLTGSGDVGVYGNPDRREVSRNGSGSVDFRD